jgi:hypothetical protein
MSFFDLQLLIAPLPSFGHCTDCPSSIYNFWSPLCHPLAIALNVLLRFTASDRPFAILWPLHWMSFFDLQLLIAPLPSFGYCIECPSLYSFWSPLCHPLAIALNVLLRITTSDYLFGIFKLFLLVVKLMSSLQNFYGRHHDLTEYLCHKLPWLCSVCRNASFMTVHRVCNTTGATCEACTAYQFTPRF